ncbi:MAG: glycosyltransferase family 4 protein [Bacteroidota bacterium]
MNILVLHQYFLEEDGSGGARFNEMSRIWAEMNHKVTVLAGMMPDHTGKKRNEYRRKKFAFKKQGPVNVIRCHVSEFYNRNFLGRFFGYFTFCFYSLWAGLFKLKGKYDLILVTSPPIFLGLTALIISKSKKIPMVFEVRDLWPESAIDTGVLRNRLVIKLAYWFEKFLYNKSKLINVLTPAFKDNLIENKLVDPKKIIYIPNAADFRLSDNLVKTFDPMVLRTQKNTIDSFVIIYVGAHGLANGLHQILDTAELLADTNVMFWLIGKGMQRNLLISESKRRKIKNIEFIDPVPRSDVFKYILASDIGASVLVKNDTFKTIYSNKTFDYMSCKKPVLLAIDGVSRKMIEEADAGIYVEPENPKDFSNKIRFCMKNQELLKQQGENGYNYVKKHFDREMLAKEYIEKLKSIS